MQHTAVDTILTNIYLQTREWAFTTCTGASLHFYRVIDEVLKLNSYESTCKRLNKKDTN